MSREAVIELLRKADGDAGLRRDLEGALEAGDDAAASFLAVAARHGFEFTADEFDEAVLAHEENRELSDEDLEGVAGGAFQSPARLKLVSGARRVFARDIPGMPPPLTA